jgi:glycosyltransferase involved in cell wall biosynthesis
MTLSEPTVSVIVPNYNHARFLRQRLDSILNQTYQDFELILLDDCSTDDSVAVLKEYAKLEKVTHFVCNTANSGSPFSQWQRGLGLAKGRFIWIAESDDLAHPDLLAVLVAKLEADADVVLSYCRSQTIDDDGADIWGDYFWPDDMDRLRWRLDFCNDGHAEISRYLVYRNTIPNASSVVFRRFDGVEEKVRTDLRYVGDWVFWGRLLRHGKLCFSSRTLNGFRYHAATSRAVASISKERLRFAEYLLAIDEFSSGVSRYSVSAQGHQWMVGEWLGRFDGLPTYLLLNHNISIRTRVSFYITVLRSRCRKTIQSMLLYHKVKRLVSKWKRLIA